jgi:hypothetical protein
LIIIIKEMRHLLFFAATFIFLTIYVRSDVTYPYTCPVQRSDVCTAEYLGVCGWYRKSKKCTTSPCAVDGATACSSCSNQDVIYVTLGKCADSNQKEIKYTYPYTCQNSDRKVDCSGLTFSDGKVCGKYKSNVQCIKAPCALDAENLCLACNDENVESVSLGGCSDKDSQPKPSSAGSVIGNISFIVGMSLIFLVLF